MNLKKSLTGIVGAFALVASLLAPGVMVQAQSLASGGGTGEVTVTSDGEFSVNICNSEVPISFGSVGASTDSDVTTSGSLSICIVDTHVDRPGFLTMLSASEFGASGLTPIPASSLIPTVIYGPVVGQMLPVWTDGGYIFGDHNNPGAGHIVVEPVVSPASANSEVWGGGDFSSSQQVGHGDAGRGSSWAEQQVDLELTIPANTLPGDYTNTITVDLTYRAP